jgi:hypothetical protein
MKSGFKDPIAIKNQKPMDKPKDGMNSPFDFTCPQYDQRSSCFVNAGTNYGVGHNQPVGKFSASNSGAIPYGRVTTMKIDETY